jgi:hypothetical protein
LHRRFINTGIALVAASIALLLLGSLGGTSGIINDWVRTVVPRIQPATEAASEYEVVILNASAGLSDTTGRGVGGSQSVGTGRIDGAPDPEQTHALLWLQGSPVGVDLHPLNFRYSAALDTNGQQQVGHGNGAPTGYQEHALLWNGSSSNYIDLHPAGIWTASTARGIGGNQQVGNINYYYQGNESSSQSLEHAALWRGSPASVVDLHPAGIGCDRSYANATDGSRQVGYGYFSSPNSAAPYRALLWSGSASVVILHPAGYTHSFAEGVGGNEQVGYAFNSQGDGYARALLWHGSPTGVVNLHPAAYLSSTALATNGTTQVGFGGGPTTNWQSHALRWFGSAQSAVDLHGLLPAEFIQGSSIAYDIDGMGNITGLAQRPDGSTVAVLWRRTGVNPSPTPTPTPLPTPTPTPTPAPNISPKVQLNSPASGQVFTDRDPIQIVATATDSDGYIARVDFYANDQLIGTAKASSRGNIYKYAWNVSVRRSSQYRLQAQAIDNRGAKGVSNKATITVRP